MEKLILKKQRYRTNSQQYRIRVSGEVYEIVDKLSERTKMSLNEIASKMIMYAYEHTKVIDEEEDSRCPLR